MHRARIAESHIEQFRLARIQIAAAQINSDSQAITITLGINATRPTQGDRLICQLIGNALATRVTSPQIKVKSASHRPGIAGEAVYGGFDTIVDVTHGYRHFKVSWTFWKLPY
ncbi:MULTISPECIES: hypothetical protein [unclassified Pseudomonas]|jgi:hypothetical protein